MSLTLGRAAQLSGKYGVWHFFTLAAGIAALGALAYTATLYWPIILAKPLHTAQQPVVCDFSRSACIAKFATGETISLHISPAHLPSMQPLALNVRSPGLRAKKVDISFRGASMNMGLTQTRLSKQAGGHHTGQAQLPVCIRSRMNWLAEITLQTHEAQWMAVYSFTSGVNDPNNGLIEETD